MFRTPMPETPIDEHRDFRAKENDIDRDAFDATMQSEPQSFRMERRAESTFRFRILVLHPTHDLGARQRLSTLPIRLPLVGSVSAQSGHLFSHRYRMRRAFPVEFLGFTAFSSMCRTMLFAMARPRSTGTAFPIKRPTSLK